MPATLRELITLKRQIGDLVANNPEYKAQVSQLVAQFGTIKDLTDEFMGTVVDNYKPQKRLYDAILSTNVQVTKDALLGAGIRDNFGNAIQEVLKANISGVATRADLYETLSRFIQGTATERPFLERYIKQTVNDSVMVFNREYLQTISEDLGLKHYLYQGTKIDDTRPFCSSRIGNYYTKDEVQKWANQNWAGKMAGTNATTIFSYAGGYNCRHKIWPVSEEQYNRAKGITTPIAPRATPPAPITRPAQIPAPAAPTSGR